MDPLFPLLYFLAPCWGKTLAALGTFKMLDDSPGDEVEVSILHRIEVRLVWLTDRIQTVDNSTDWVGVGIVQRVDSHQSAGLCF